MWFCSSSHQEVESIHPTFESGLALSLALASTQGTLLSLHVNRLKHPGWWEACGWVSSLISTNSWPATRHVSEAILDQPAPAILPADGRCTSEPSQHQPGLVQINRTIQLTLGLWITIVIVFIKPLSFTSIDNGCRFHYFGNSALR